MGGGGVAVVVGVGGEGGAETREEGAVGEGQDSLVGVVIPEVAGGFVGVAAGAELDDLVVPVDVADGESGIVDERPELEVGERPVLDADVGFAPAVMTVTSAMSLRASQKSVQDTVIRSVRSEGFMWWRPLDWAGGGCGLRYWGRSQWRRHRRLETAGRGSGW